MFYERTFFVQKFFFSQSVIRKSLSFEKGACKTLMKLTPGVNPKNKILLNTKVLSYQY